MCEMRRWVLHKTCNGNWHIFGGVFLFTLAAHHFECRMPDLSTALEKYDIQQSRLLPVSAALEWALSSNQRVLCYLYPFSIVDCKTEGDCWLRRGLWGLETMYQLVATSPESWKQVIQKGPKSTFDEIHRNCKAIVENYERPKPVTWHTCQRFSLVVEYQRHHGEPYHPTARSNGTHNVDAWPSRWGEDERPKLEGFANLQSWRTRQVWSAWNPCPQSRFRKVTARLLKFKT